MTREPNFGIWWFIDLFLDFRQKKPQIQKKRRRRRRLLPGNKNSRLDVHVFTGVLFVSDSNQNEISTDFWKNGKKNLDYSEKWKEKGGEERRVMSCWYRWKSLMVVVSVLSLFHFLKNKNHTESSQLTMVVVFGSFYLSNTTILISP